MLQNACIVFLKIIKVIKTKKDSLDGTLKHKKGETLGKKTKGMWIKLIDYFSVNIKKTLNLKAYF